MFSSIVFLFVPQSVMYFICWQFFSFYPELHSYTALKLGCQRLGTFIVTSVIWHQIFCSNPPVFVVAISFQFSCLWEQNTDVSCWDEYHTGFEHIENLFGIDPNLEAFGSIHSSPQVQCPLLVQKD